jgi:hypothetical protein
VIISFVLAILVVAILVWVLNNIDHAILVLILSALAVYAVLRRRRRKAE